MARLDLCWVLLVARLATGPFHQAVVAEAFPSHSWPYQRSIQARSLAAVLEVGEERARPGCLQELLAHFLDQQDLQKLLPTSQRASLRRRQQRRASLRRASAWSQKRKRPLAVVVG